MAGTTDAEAVAVPSFGLNWLLTRIPRWAYAILVLVVAIVVLWALIGKPILQAVVTGLAVGSIYVLGASGLSLTYGIKKFANFAHGDLMTVGAYAAFYVNVTLAQNIYLGVAYAILVVAILGVLLELSIFRRLEGRGPVPALIASVGVSLVLQNAISAIYTTNVLYLRVTPPQDIPLGGTGLSFNVVKQGVTLAVAVVLIVFLHVMLRYTTLGKAMRACSDDMDLARTSGIRVRNVILWTWAISGAFAAVAGVLLAVIVNVFPLLGFFVLLFIFAAVIVGGIGSPYGAMLGGLIIGVVQKMSNVVFGQIQNQPIPLSFVLGAVLLAMGLFGALITAERRLRLGFVSIAGIGIGMVLATSILGWSPFGAIRIEGGAEYESVGAFLVMVAFLLLMPEGIMGARRQAAGGRIAALRGRRRGVGVKEAG